MRLQVRSVREFHLGLLALLDTMFSVPTCLNPKMRKPVCEWANSSMLFSEYVNLNVLTCLICSLSFLAVLCNTPPADQTTSQFMSARL